MQTPGLEDLSLFNILYINYSCSPKQISLNSMCLSSRNEGVEFNLVLSGLV